MIGDVHALEYVFHLPAHFNLTARRLKDMIKEVLVVHVDVQPPPQYKLHDEAILKQTLHRFHELVRGSLDWEEDWGISSVRGKKPEDLDVACDKLLQLFNSDIRQATITHYCCGCCLNADDTASKMAAAAIESGLVAGLSGQLPAKSRWGTCLTSMARQATGFMFHNLLGYAACAMLATWEDGDPNAGDDDFRQTIRKKAWRAKHFCADEERRQLVGEKVWTTVPLDHCWRRLQFLDAGKGALSDLVFGQDQPLRYRPSPDLRLHAASSQHWKLSTIVPPLRRGTAG